MRAYPDLGNLDGQKYEGVMSLDRELTGLSKFRYATPTSAKP